MFLVFAFSFLKIIIFIGVNYLGSVIICEWINQVLKWILHGHRPYWYIKSSNQQFASMSQLKQTPITCETGPGNPSGHVMINVVTGLTLVNFILSCANNWLSDPMKLIVRRMLWNGFFVFIAMVVASRYSIHYNAEMDQRSLFVAETEA